MKDNESKNLVFMGESINIKAQGQFVNNKNEFTKSKLLSYDFKI